jgi:copper ion binding protein
MSVTTTYQVRGMTCAHCVRSVSAEIGALSGVETVSVELATGAVVVSSRAPLDQAAVRAAVDEAGYELAG